MTQKKAWECVQEWYQKASGQQQKQCHVGMEDQTTEREREKLYAKVAPPGNNIPYNVPPTNVDDDKPQDTEIRPVVEAAKGGKAKGINLLQAEHIKLWLWRMECEEQYEDGG